MIRETPCDVAADARSRRCASEVDLRARGGRRVARRRVVARDSLRAQSLGRLRRLIEQRPRRTRIAKAR
jgi:hypothetical protein